MKKILPLPINFIKLWRKNTQGYQAGVIKYNGILEIIEYIIKICQINAMLIEIGGVDNTFEEMYLTVDAFADVFSEFYWDAKAVDN